MKLDELKELGLSKGQIKVYSSILESGIASLNKIQQKTGLERRGIYDIINKLIEKGLISYTVENGKRKYQCTHPNKILEEIKDRKQALEDLRKKVPEIKNMFKLTKSEIEAEVFRGEEAIKSLFNEILEEEECFVIGGNWFNKRKESTQSLVNFFNHWMKKRAEKKIMMYDLVDYGTVLDNINMGNISQHRRLYFKCCELPPDLQSPLVIWIFGNKVAQIIWKEQPFAFVLESPDIKESFMKYFNFFWKDPW